MNLAITLNFKHMPSNLPLSKCYAKNHSCANIGRWRRDAMKFKPRLEILQFLHGKPVLELNAERVQIPDRVYAILKYTFCERVAYEAWQSGYVETSPGKKIGLFKWFKKIGLEDKAIQDLQNAFEVKTYTMILSCSYRDMIRASVSKHFTSCYKDNAYIIEMLERPDVCIIGAKDKSGDYYIRYIAFLGKDGKLYLNPTPYPKPSRSKDLRLYALIDGLKIMRTDLVDVTNYDYSHRNPWDDGRIARFKYLYDDAFKFSGTSEVPLKQGINLSTTKGVTL